MYTLEAVGLPLPIEIPLLLSGRMVLGGQAGLPLLAATTWAGTSVGNLISYFLARRLGRPLLMRAAGRLGMERQILRMEGWLDRYGLLAIVVTRWINWGFALSLWAAGLSGIDPRRAFRTMLLNNLVWSIAWAMLGRTVAGMLHTNGLPAWWVLAPGLLLLSVGLIWRGYRRIREG